MVKFLAMTAFALVLGLSPAHAEYTGSGAISGSGASAKDSSSDAAKQRLKDDWDKFRNVHEQTWDKLEAARRAHWHGIGAHVAATADSTDSSAASGDTAPGPKPSKWERFKERHQDQKQSLEEHGQDMKESLDARKDEARSNAKDWAAEHKGKVAATKEKVQQWQSDHKEKMDAMKEGVKDKWAAWRASH